LNSALRRPPRANVARYTGEEINAVSIRPNTRGGIGATQDAFGNPSAFPVKTLREHGLTRSENT